MYAGYATYYPSLTCWYDFFTYGGAYHQQPGFTRLWCWCCLHPG